MDTPTPTDGPAKTRPARNRRTSAGLIGNEIDIQILDFKLKEDQIAIAYNTPVIMGTSSALAEDSVEHDRVVSTVVNERYFTRPEVIRSYRERAIIQTPSFVNLADHPEKVSRTRPKVTSQQPIADSASDATYEKRHKRYETFEKRLRSRDKEKLVHDHYKLKERIEQLRSLDPSAFMSLEPSWFSPPPDNPEGEEYNEGERRQKEMLDQASLLDDRYRQLLPPERVGKKAPRPIEPSLEETSEEQAYHPTPVPQQALRAKLPKASSASSTSTRSPSYAPSNASPATNKRPRLIGPGESGSSRSRPRLAKQQHQLAVSSSAPPPEVRVIGKPQAFPSGASYEYPLDAAKEEEEDFAPPPSSNIPPANPEPEPPAARVITPAPPVSYQALSQMQDVALQQEVFSVGQPNDHPFFPPTSPHRVLPPLNSCAPTTEGIYPVPDYPYNEKPEESVSTISRPAKKPKKGKVAAKTKKTKPSRAPSLPQIEALPLHLHPDMPHGEADSTSIPLTASTSKGGAKGRRGPMKHKIKEPAILEASRRSALGHRKKQPRSGHAFHVGIPEGYLAKRAKQFSEEFPWEDFEWVKPVMMERMEMPDGTDSEISDCEEMDLEEEDVDQLEDSLQPEERVYQQGQASSLPQTPGLADTPYGTPLRNGYSHSEEGQSELGHHPAYPTASFDDQKLTRGGFRDQYMSAA